MSLFDSAVEERLRERGPLAARLRPRTLDDVVGQDHLLGPRGTLRALLDAGRLTSIILWGPAGTGKTTIARLLAEASGAAFESLSAVSAGVKDVREVSERAKQRLGERGTATLLLLDEVHRFNRAQQDALLPGVEDGTIVLVGSTTENPFFEVNGPLLSRSTLLRLQPLDGAALEALLGRGLEAEQKQIDSDARQAIVEMADGDGRALLTTLEVAAAIAGDEETVTLDHVARAGATRSLAWSRDDHYDVTSALIKSIRGGDVDAGLHYLARMIAAGDDPRFIARRLVILASEDVGMADPMALVVADAAARAVEFVGFPEAQLNLAQAVVHLATAPKSNRTALGIWRALEDVRSHPSGPVPPHLRDSHYRGAATLGHGEGYRYPHDDPRGWVEQQYLPDELAGTRYYEPSAHGEERAVAERLEERSEGGSGEDAGDRRGRRGRRGLDQGASRP